MDWEKPYRLKIERAARDLETALRTQPSGKVGIWAIGPDESARRNGRLHVGTVPPSEFGATYIRPTDNGASAHHRWDAVPFSALPSILATACRRAPIVDVFEEPAGIA